MQDIEQPSEQRRLLDVWREGDSVPQKEQRLTDMQKEFALQLVTNGGNALEAATVAGYQFPEVASVKLLLHFGVVHMINRLTVEIWKGKLPSLFANLHGIAFSKTATDRARVDATNSLLDRLGATVPKGPSTAIQINTGSGSGELAKGQAQVIISELWNARQERQQIRERAHDAAAAYVERDKARKESDILATMSDKEPDAAMALLEHIVNGDDDVEPDMVGGGDFPGAPAPPSSIPAPLSSHLKNLSQENDDERIEQPSVIWTEISDERAPARSGEAGGFGGGEGIVGEVRGAGDDGLDRVIETRAHADEEIFQRLDASDDAGFVSDDGRASIDGANGDGPAHAGTAHVDDVAGAVGLQPVDRGTANGGFGSVGSTDFFTDD